MIPDAEQRLAQALGDLEDMLVRLRTGALRSAGTCADILRTFALKESAEDTEASESEAYKKAIAALKLARPQ